MWYAITALDVADSLELRKTARPAHLERLNTLQAEGRLKLAGLSRILGVDGRERPVFPAA